MQFMSPSVGRRNKFDDESQLILNSPTSSDGDGNSIINGNTEVGFVFPSVNLKKTPVHQVSKIKKVFFKNCNFYQRKVLGTRIVFSNTAVILIKAHFWLYQLSKAINFQKK